MRHRKNFNQLSRKSAHRKAMLANMANSLIMHKRIKTTVAKAKALRGFIEPLITKSKNDSTHSRRVVFGYLQDKDSVSELFREVGAKVANRPGGYTRILKLGNRLGDNADMCIMELVDYNELKKKKKEEATKTKKKTRRRGRRRSGSKTQAQKQQSQQQETESKSAEEIKAEPETKEKQEADKKPEAEETKAQTKTEAKKEPEKKEEKKGNIEDKEDKKE